MARNPEDVFASLRVNGPEKTAAPQPEAPAEGAPPRDVFAALRIPGTGDTPAPNIPRPDNSLGEEFIAGLGQGIDSMQGSMYGVAAMLGRETGIGWMEDAGMKGASEQFAEAAENGAQAPNFTDIESAGGFFEWTANTLGQAIPSLAMAMSGGGIGASIGKKSIELGVKKSLARNVERRLAKYGYSKEEALVGARDYMLSDTGKTALARAFTQPRTGALIAERSAQAARAGSATGAVAVAALPQIGAIDQELINAGVADPGLTALIGGIAGGALEAVPALRLLDKMFPGVDRQVSKHFVKDFAVSTGTQLALEGSTEAAQEIIALASHAYKDPTFDMFSPDAKTRVIEAFAAGALVGAVTGGGAEAIGGLQTGARQGTKAAVPVIGAWTMDVKDKAGKTIESVLPEDFTPADKTVFEEIRHRMYSTIQPHIETAVNSLQKQVDAMTQTVNDSLEGGLNAETAKISDIARAAHDAFIKKHTPQIESLKKYMDREVERIARTARTMKDPQERAKFVEGHVQAAKDKVGGYLEKLRRDAAERDQNTQAEVDNMDFDDDMLNQMGFEEEVEETERRAGPSGRTFERSVGPAIQQESSVVPKEGTIQAGETEAQAVTTWGRNQLTPKIDTSGKETVVPYKTRADAQKGRQNLRKKFPRHARQDDAFRLTQVEGGWVIESIDPALREDMKFWDDFDSVRASATRRKANPRKVTLEGVDGSQFGYKFKNLSLDVETMAHRGKNLDPNAKTMQQGFRAFAGELLARGVINNEQFTKLDEAATTVLGKDKDATIDQFAAPPKFQTSGVATHVMINFKEHLAQQGIDTPRNLFDVEQNDDGTWSFGFNRDKPAIVRAFRAKDAAQFKRIFDELKKFRRDEQLDKANRDEGAFSGNIVLDEGGDLGDTRGDTAGDARIATDPIRTGRTGEGKRTATRTKTGGQSAEGRSAATTLDTDPQADDRTTDPKNQPSEFATRHKRYDPATGKVDKSARDNARELSARDKALLKRWARPGSVKILLSIDVAQSVTLAVADLANFVTKTLGLSNQITVLDDTGLRLLIEAGHVTDPIFTQTLNDPSVNARNIRINDNSFVYLSSKVLSDPALTVLAFGHEMGHHVYRVAWDSLTPEAQQRLKDAYTGTLTSKKNENPAHAAQKATVDALKAERAAIVADPFLTKEQAEALKDVPKEEKSAVGRIAKLDAEIAAAQSTLDTIPATTTQRGKAGKQFDEAGFNEWMADQLAAWIVQRKAPDGPAQSFFAKVAGKIRQLYDFIAKNPRFQLNETFREFADAVAMKARAPQDKTANPYDDAHMKAWFRNEGVNMYKWFGETLETKNNSQKQTAKTKAEKELLDTRLQINTIFSNPGNEEASQSGDPNDLKVFKNDYQELAVVEKMLVKRVAAEARRAKSSVEVDNMAFDFKPLTAEGQKALARVEKNYPAIVKRAVTLRNWISTAYKMVAAPSTSVIRAMPYKSAQKLVSIFNRQAMGKAKGEGNQNYHQAVELMRGQFMTQYTKITKSVEADIKSRRPDIKNAELQTLVNAKMREVGRSLQQKDGDPAATFNPLEQAVRKLFDDAHAYATKAGLPVRKVVNYFPRSFSRELLIENKQKILDHLIDGVGMPLAKARSLYNSLIDPDANDGRATQDATETPGFKAMNSRKVQDKFFDQFLDDNTDGIVANYVNQVVKRAEFNRRLGEAMPATGLDAKQAIKEGIWDPKGKMHKLIAEARKEKASDEEIVLLEKYIDANLGQLGRDDIKPGLRKFMAGVMAYQNMRILLFTVFSSLPDMVGPAIRGGGMRAQFNVIKKHIHDMATDDNALADMARAYGIIQDAASEHIVTEYVDNHYMPPTLRKWNDNFFKYTGLNWYTDFTRKMALATGIDFIQQQAELIDSTDSKVAARAEDMLAELGITALDVKAWNLAGRPTMLSHSSNGLATDASVRKVAEALVQFVDESIMRPNASQRPILASHPSVMLVYHLKGYMYAIHDIVLKRIKFNIDESQTPAQYAAAIAPAIAMMLLTAVGLELREIIQYAGSNRQPPTDRMDGWEYTFELMQRSGLTGFAQIAFDFEGAEDRGMTHVAGIGGPALSQAYDLLTKPHTQTIPKAIPVIGQIPALRAATRTVL